jgi:hypothetical protein
MRAMRMHYEKTLRSLAGALALTAAIVPIHALDKPTGAPLELSSIETEQGIPLAIVSPNGKTVSCVTVRLHWNPQANVAANDDSTSFALDVAADSPGASIFLAQLWNASLASALAWQQPWQGARWKILDTPATDGTGVDAGLAVGMIATSARRPYPKTTLVIGGLKPDGSLGAVSRLAERLDAAAAAGITRVIIPSVQRFDVDGSGQVLNIIRHADDLHLECIPVDNLVDATEAAMNDPLPDIAVSSSVPKYSDDVATYIDTFAHREQDEAASGFTYAPKEDDLAKYPSRVAAIWKSIYADNETAEQAYRAGQVYTAYRLFERINGRMRGVNAMAGQSPIAFDVKAALAETDDLRRRVHEAVSPPSIDKGELGSAVLVAEMTDWAYDISADLAGAELVTKQAFSQRTDANAAEKDRAREAILFANEEANYLLNGIEFYNGLLSHVDANPIPVDENATHLLPQLIPAQLATAQLFTEGIRPRANDLRDGLLFDPRLVAYIDVLRDTEAAWDARQHKKNLDATPAASTDAAGTSTKLDGSGTTGTAAVGFDPGNTYAPPHTVLAPSGPVRSLSDVAACLIWVNNDCEIAALDEKYLRLNGTVDPVTHEWHVKDRAKLDALLQSAESGARVGISFAEKAEIDTSVLDMIYERASQLRIQSDDASALTALRNYWRCALLGNLCWQLAHAHKAQPVDLSAAGDDKDKSGKDAGKKDDSKTASTDKTGGKDKNTDKVDPEATAKTDDQQSGDKTAPEPNTTNAASAQPPPDNETPPPSPPETPAPVVPVVPVVASDPPVIPPSTSSEPNAADPPSRRALPVTDEATVTPAAAPAPAPIAPPAPTSGPAPSVVPSPAPVPGTSPATASIPAPVPAPPAPPSTATTAPDESNIPVAPVARPEDYTGGENGAGAAAPTTNGAPVVGPIPPPASNP